MKIYSGSVCLLILISSISADLSRFYKGGEDLYVDYDYLEEDGIGVMMMNQRTVTVMFVDQTVGGMLAKRLQKAEDAIAEMVGYRVRMVETSGTQLCRLLPNTNP